MICSVPRLLRTKLVVGWNWCSRRSKLLIEFQELDWRWVYPRWNISASCWASCPTKALLSNGRSQICSIMVCDVSILFYLSCVGQLYLHLMSACMSLTLFGQYLINFSFKLHEKGSFLPHRPSSDPPVTQKWLRQNSGSNFTQNCHSNCIKLKENIRLMGRNKCIFMVELAKHWWPKMAKIVCFQTSWSTDHSFQCTHAA